MIKRNQAHIKENSLYSHDSERSILGSMIIDNSTIDDVIEILQSKDFHEKAHQEIYNNITEIHSNNESIDIITISDRLNKNDMVSKKGGLSYLASIVDNTPTAENVLSYVKIVSDYSKRRRLQEGVRRVHALSTDQSLDVNDILNESSNIVCKIAEESTHYQNEPQQISSLIAEFTDHIDRLSESENGITGIASGFIDLDKKTTGLHPANLIIVAGRPSMGKTTFAMNIAENVSKDAKKPVLVFSLEMPKMDLMSRMISSAGHINQNKMRSARLDDSDYQKYAGATQIIKKMNLHIDDTAGLSPADMRSRARKIYRKEGLSLIVIDYLQLMSIPGFESNRTQEVSEISRSLKALSKELNVPVIALSQLNRAVDDRTDKRPLMSDLRESGAIEQDADVIMFVYRDEVYNQDPLLKGRAEIIVSKQRNGPIGTIPLTFQGEYSKFSNSFQEEKKYW